MYIFLDIDGVLNKESDWARPYTLNNENVQAFIKLVHKISNPKIILTSSWRVGWSPAFEECTAQIQTLLCSLREAGISISGKTEQANSRDRAKEIRYFLNHHPQDRYIIIDDDRSEFQEEMEHLYLTDPEYGLTDKDVKKILKDAKNCHF
jgi:hypothetical protein